MANNADNNPTTLGIDILKGDNDNKLYVINEVLNYYQRKLRVLGISAARNLSHFVFNTEKMLEARKLLNNLWTSKKLTPIPEHENIIKRLTESRSTRGTNVKIANDIIDFLQVEDSRLNIIFLTLNCEEIPSNVHEKDVLKDIYILLDKSEHENYEIMEHLRDREVAFRAYQNLVNEMVTGVKNDMCKGFVVLANLLENKLGPIANRAAPLNVPEDNLLNSNNLGNAQLTVEHGGITASTAAESAAADTTIAAITNSTTTAATARTANDEREASSATAAIVSAIVNESITSTAETDAAATDVNANIAASDIAASSDRAAADADNRAGAGVMHLPATYESADSLPSHSNESADSTEHDEVSILEEGECDGLSDCEDEPIVEPRHRSEAHLFLSTFELPRPNSDRAQQVFRMARPIEEEVNSSRYEGNSQPNTTEPGNREPQNTHNSGSNRTNRRKYNPFILKKKKSYVQDEGDDIIPFTAIRETYRYKAFVTRLSPDNDIEAMRRHINSKLGVTASIKVMSKQDDPVLTISVYCTSEYDTLDFKMPGLWPRGTGVFTWKPTSKNGNNYEHNDNGHVPTGGRNQRSGPRQGNNGRNRSSSPRNREYGNGYEYEYADQRRLNGQWRDR